MGTFVVYQKKEYDEAATLPDTDPLKETLFERSRLYGMEKLGRKIQRKFDHKPDIAPRLAILRSFRSIIDNEKYMVRFETDVRGNPGDDISIKAWDVLLQEGVQVDSDDDRLVFDLRNVADPNETGTVKLNIKKDARDGNDFEMNIGVPRNSAIENDFAYLDNIIDDLSHTADLLEKRYYLLGVTTFSRCR